MALLSKPLNENEKEIVHKRLCQMVLMGVTTQNLCLMVDTHLITEAVAGDQARAAAMLAATSSVAGVIEFLLNPVVGKLTDEYGRKWVYSVGPFLSGIVATLAVLATKGKSLPVLFAHKAMSWALVSMSLSFIGPITLSDIYSGPELGIRLAKFFGSIGLAVIFAPGFGAQLMQRTGDPMLVFKLRLLVAAAQLFFVNKYIPETLTLERQKKFDITDINPFSFVKLFQKSRTLRTVTLMLFFSCCAEGKNIVPLMQTWMNGYPLKWPIDKQTIQSGLFGVLAMASGMVMAPKLMKALGPRGFTSFTNTMNAVGLSLTGLPIPSYDIASWLGLLLHGPGINNTNSAAMKAVGADHAVANGFARGEYGGMQSGIRTLSLICAPPVFGWAYQKGMTPGKNGQPQFPGLPWLLVALVGGILPELLHRSISDQDLEATSAPTKQA